jgi:hypothetical protein
MSEQATMRELRYLEDAVQAIEQFHRSSGCDGTLRVMTPADLPPPRE